MKRKGVVLLMCCAAVSLVYGCATQDGSVGQAPQQEAQDEQAVIELAPGDRGVLLTRAREYLKQRDYVNALVSIVRAERTQGGEELSDEIGMLKNDIVERLNARVIYGEESVHVGKGLDAPLKYMVFYTDDEVIYPAFNVPVRFEVHRGKAQITQRGFTNTSGVAECTVTKIERLDGDEVIITADVDLQIDGTSFTISKLQRDFTLRYIGVKERTISFVIFEQNIDEVVLSSTSGKTIERFFIDNGYSVLQGIHEFDREAFMRAHSGDEDFINAYGNRLNSSFIALAYIESIFSSKIMDGFYFARSNIFVTIIDSSTNEVLYSTVVKDVKGAGSTELKAGRKAITAATEKLIDNLKQEIPIFEGSG
jgi:hypothetical protein